MPTETESQFFDASDLTALVCIDHQQYQKLVVPQLIEMGYKVHLGLFEEDVLLKMRTYNYNVVFVYENFKNTNLQTNPILQELARRPGHLRRQHFVALLTHRFATNDAMSAFVTSVDQILNIADLANLKTVLRRGVTQHRELYTAFNETLRAVEAI